jgi:hypothetical protein
LHTLDIDDQRCGFGLTWKPGARVTFPVRHQTIGIKRACFYVPRGTRHVAGFAFRLRLEDADGQLVYTPKEDMAGYFSVEVPPGQDGKLWRAQAYELNLLSVPPYVALDAGGLLLPQSVVEAEERGTLQQKRKDR